MGPCTPTDPCDGQEDCTTIVDSCTVSPSRNTLSKTVSASLNFTTSMDVFCNHDMPNDGQWGNVVHMTSGGNRGNIGDRHFSIFTKNDGLSIRVNDPNESHNERVFEQS